MHRTSSILLVAVGILCLAAFAFAGGAVVKDTPHNLSPAGPDQAIRAAANSLGNEICVYCHTPHGGSTRAPLWNRAAQPTSTTYAKYSSTTMDASAPSDATILASVSGACLSCHDGTVAVDNLLNYQGTAHSPSITFTTQAGATATYANTGTGVNNIMSGGIPFLGTELTNDHPIAITYNTAFTAQTPTEFNAPLGTTKITVTGGGNTLPIFGTGTTVATVECGSCHNPHNDTYDRFLRISNSGSNICYVCHIK